MLQYYTRKMSHSHPSHAAAGDHLWVYGAGTTKDELDELADKYGLNASILKDVKDKDELPRAEFDKDTLYVFIRLPRQTADHNLVTVPFLTVLKGTTLFTLSSKQYLTPNDLFDGEVEIKNTKRLFLNVINYVVDQYRNDLHEAGIYLKNTTHRLEQHKIADKDFIKFVTVEGNLNEYQANLSDTRTVLLRLRENHPQIFNDKDCDYIDDIVLHINQLLVSTEGYTRVITSIRNAYTTISNNGLNQRMKTLTLLTLFLALPNVFFGMYGMNVILPFADQPWAYPAIVSISLVLVIFVYWLVRRLRF